MSAATWQQILRQNFIQWEKLADYLELSEKQREQIYVHPNFSLNLPLRLARKIKKGTFEDPILRQFLPTTEEKKPVSGYTSDPVGDLSARKSSRLLHKYQGRALLLFSSACAMHCRYCFRQNFDYAIQKLDFEKEIKIIAEDPSIKELILSGGDPLSMPNRAFSELFEQLKLIPHLKHIRFHTRFPIGIPERLDSEFINILTQKRFKIWFIIHCNHASELDSDVLNALKNVQEAGAVILNQAVLLRGVNDSVETLYELASKLFDNGILFYYLHQLDKVKGAAHFEVPINEGMQLMTELAKQLPGYALPRYVQEVAGAPGKVILF